jgi:hypothetical protein
MAVPNLSEALAKVLIDDAWADGKLAQEEMENLKDILFRYCSAFRDETDGVPALEWTKVEMYIESPVSAADSRVHRYDDRQRSGSVSGSSFCCSEC